MNKKNHRSIAEDLIKQRRELEQKPPTLDELAEEAANNYLSKKSKLLPLSQEQWEEKLNTIVSATSTSYPERNQDFLDNIPEMHRSWKAIGLVNKNLHLAELYVMMMIKIYKDGFPFELEKIILALDEENIIWQMEKKDYRWSHRGQRIMSCLHPQVYKRVSAGERPTMAVFTI